MIVAGVSLVSSCKMAPKDDPGDTVAASVFAPVDTAALHRKQRAEKARLAHAKDSIGIFYIGAGRRFSSSAILHSATPSPTVRHAT